MPTPRQYTDRAEKQAAYRKRQADARRAEQEAKGLPALPSVPTLPGEKRWQAMQEQARTLLQMMADEMQAYYDERSEKWQESDKDDAMQERMDALQSIVTDLDTLS
jgi:hypothetical protein